MSRKASLGLALAIMVVAGYAVFAAKGWPWKAALFPLAIGIPLFCLAAAEVAWGLLEKKKGPDLPLSDDVPPETVKRRTLAAWLWMAALLALVVLLGFPIAVALFTFVYLRLQGRESWLVCAIFTALLWGAFYGLFDGLLHLPFPAGWLLEWVGLA